MAIIKNKLSFKSSGAKESLIIAGVAHGVKTGKTQYGDFVGFRGNFIGYADGNMADPISSPVCFLPNVATEMLTAAMEEAAGGSIEFGFKITREASDKSTVGYEYICQPLLQSTSSIDALAAKVSAAAAAALPAPTPEPETDTKAAKAKAK